MCLFAHRLHSACAILRHRVQRFEERYQAQISRPGLMVIALGGMITPEPRIAARGLTREPRTHCVPLVGSRHKGNGLCFGCARVRPTRASEVLPITMRERCQGRSYWGAMSGERSLASGTLPLFISPALVFLRWFWRICRVGRTCVFDALCKLEHHTG